MKVFLSWSKDRSKYIAQVLHDWLPSVIQSVEPFLSSRDIGKGQVGRDVIARSLEKADVGIIVLTPENLDERWILFEAGALSKSLDDARVMTYLYDLDNANIPSPLGDFQWTRAKERDDNWQLVQTVNSAIAEDDRLTDAQLRKAFDKWWDELEDKLQNVPELDEAETVEPPKPEEMLQEILRVLRRQRSQSGASTRLPYAPGEVVNRGGQGDGELDLLTQELQLTSQIEHWQAELANATSGTRQKRIKYRLDGLEKALRDVEDMIRTVDPVHTSSPVWAVRDPTIMPTPR